MSSSMLAGEPSTLPSVDALSDDDSAMAEAEPPVAPKPKAKAKAKAKTAPKPKVKSAPKVKPVKTTQTKKEPKVELTKKPSMKRPAAKPAGIQGPHDKDPPADETQAEPVAARKAYLEYRTQTDVYSIRVKDASTGKKPEWIRVGVHRVKLPYVFKSIFLKHETRGRLKSIFSNPFFIFTKPPAGQTTRGPV